MGLYELIDLAISVGNRLDVQIGVFITVHLAIFGGIVYVDRPLRRFEKAVAIAVYAAFALLNYRMMGHQLDLMQVIYQEIAKLANDPCCQGNSLVPFFDGALKTDRLAWRGTALIWVHVVTGLVVTFSIVFDNKLTKHPG